MRERDTFRMTLRFLIVNTKSRLAGRAGGKKYRYIQEFDYFNLVCLGNNQMQIWNK